MNQQQAAKQQVQRSMSLTDIQTSTTICDAVERDLTVPADRRMHRFFLNMSKHDLVLPSLTRFDQDFRKFLFSKLIDYDLLKGLEEARCLNWCSNLPKFLPLLTLADGNCLMNAASLSMWAVNDRRMTLRKSVYQVLLEDSTDAFRFRWQLECQANLEDHHGSSVNCSKEQWDEDWKKTIALASTKKSAETQCYSGLEEIHVFALANVLRRPIIVVCDDVFRGNEDESLANIDLGGIYLPLLCDSVDCVKSPLVLGYHNGHYTALVTTEDGGQKTLSNMVGNKNAVPLVKYDGAPMKLHFLLPEEKQYSDRLLREYLNCSKVVYPENGDTAILVAIMQFQEPEPHLDQMFKTYFDTLQALYVETLAERTLTNQRNQRELMKTSSAPAATSPSTQFPVGVSHSQPCCSSHKKCKTVGCTYYTTQHSLCFKCKENKSSICTTPGCTYIGHPEKHGMCSVCFTRYHAVLEQGKSVPRPSAPSPPPDNSCRTKDCERQAVPNLHGWCYHCYLSAIQHRNAEQLRNISREASLAQKTSSPVPPPRYSRQVSLFCHNENCRNELQEPENLYCHQCMEAMSGNSPAAARQMCKYLGCTNVVNASSPSGLCTSCISNLQTPSAPKPVGQPTSSLVISVCSVSGCTMPAITYHGELCLSHYKQYQSIHRNRDAQKSCDHKHQESNDNPTNCINNGCPFYGNPETNYLCSGCHAKALQDLYDLQTIREEQERNVQESEHLLPSAPPYMYHQPYYNTETRKTFYAQGPLSTGQNSCSAPPSPSPRRKWPAATVPCATQGCPHFCMAENQQLCDRCLEKHEFGRSVGPHGRSRFCSDS